MTYTTADEMPDPFPTAQACFIVTATCVVLGNLLGDLICSWIDPRIKEELQ